MWAQGGTYAEPLMSDEQPGSWMFYEADLRTDRLSANKQRSVAWAYRQQEFCPAEALPGFAFHQTDRDVPERQKTVCPDGRCSKYSRSTRGRVLIPRPLQCVYTADRLCARRRRVQRATLTCSATATRC